MASFVERLRRDWNAATDGEPLQDRASVVRALDAMIAPKLRQAGPSVETVMARLKDKAARGIVEDGVAVTWAEFPLGRELARLVRLAREAGVAPCDVDCVYEMLRTWFGPQGPLRGAHCEASWSGDCAMNVKVSVALDAADADEDMEDDDDETYTAEDADDDDDETYTAEDAAADADDDEDEEAVDAAFLQDVVTDAAEIANEAAELAKEAADLAQMLRDEADADAGAPLARLTAAELDEDDEDDESYTSEDAAVDADLDAVFDVIEPWARAEVHAHKMERAVASANADVKSARARVAAAQRAVAVAQLALRDGAARDKTELRLAVVEGHEEVLVQKHLLRKYEVVARLAEAAADAAQESADAMLAETMEAEAEAEAADAASDTE
jgi:hypothetical protein